jgi:hypothetical protein
MRIPEGNPMRIVASLLIIILIAASAPRLAQAEQTNSCKQCGDQRRTCTSGYSAKTCQVEYERCMKNCQHK